MAGNGWIKLHRKIQQNYLWSEKRKFSKFEAWVDILLMVNHEDVKVPLGNELIEVKRGSRITSYWKLAERWQWSRTKATAFLKLLQVDGMLIVNSDTKKTVLTVVNYDFYQDRETEKSHRKDTEKTPKRRNKNEKNEKKKDYMEFVSLTEEEYQKLIDQFGESGTQDKMERLNLYKGSTGRKYDSDYMTILSWERKNKKDAPEEKQRELYI